MKPFKQNDTLHFIIGLILVLAVTVWYVKTPSAFAAFDSYVTHNGLYAVLIICAVLGFAGVLIKFINRGR